MSFVVMRHTLSQTLMKALAHCYMTGNGMFQCISYTYPMK